MGKLSDLGALGFGLAQEAYQQRQQSKNSPKPPAQSSQRQSSSSSRSLRPPSSQQRRSSFDDVYDGYSKDPSRRSPNPQSDVHVPSSFRRSPQPQDPSTMYESLPAGPPPAYDDINEKMEKVRLSPPAGDRKARSLDGFPADKEGTPESDIDHDEREWQLDEAVEESTEKDCDEEEIQSEEELVRKFFAKHPQAAPSRVGQCRPLPLPVMIPQRRPGTKDRGFVRAYAPVLEDCGIDEYTFLDFLKQFQASSKASPWFGVIQASAGIASFAPGAIAFAVTTGVGMGAQAGANYQGKYRTNKYLDLMNESLFQPRGLYAMIISNKPQGQQQSGRGGLVGMGMSMMSSGSGPSSGPLNLSGNAAMRANNAGQDRFRADSGQVGNEAELGETAPLVFPDLDLTEPKLDENGNVKKMPWYKSTGKFVANYMDKRAQQQYYQENPNSQFAGHFAGAAGQPMMNNGGGLRGMVMGGLSQGGAGGAGGRDDRRDRRDEKRDRKERRRDEKHDRHRGGRDRDDRDRYDDYGYGGPGPYGGGYGAPYGDPRYNMDPRFAGQPPYGDPRFNMDPRFGGQFPYGDPRFGGPAPYGGQRGFGDPQFSGPAPYGGQGGYGGPAPYGGQSQYGGYDRRGDDRRDRRGKKEKGGLVGGIKRKMGSGVLYLLIVNLPSQEEMEAAQRMSQMPGGQNMVSHEISQI